MRDEAALPEHREAHLEHRKGLLESKKVLHERIGGLLGDREVLSEHREGLREDRKVHFEHREGLKEDRKVLFEHREGLPEHKEVLLEYEDGLLEDTEAHPRSQVDLSEYKEARLEHKEALLEYREARSEYKEGLLESPAMVDGDLAGQTIVVTGANTGIGRATAERLAARGAHVVLACRSEEKTRPVVDRIRASGGTADFELLDLADVASARACASRLAARFATVDVLINNGGVAGQRGATKDGFELTFGTNHVGHFVLTVLLMRSLRASPRARIVTVSSKLHERATGIDFERVRRPTRSLTGLPEYAVSKLANILFTRELARRLGPDGPRTYVLHPGGVASDIYRRVPRLIRPLVTRRMLSTDEGALTSLYCATSPEVADATGCYYVRCQERAPSAVAERADLAAQLWERTVQWTGTDLA
jgi:NAD(P)-dependent dehydrogenase (short-subunit alcohol dehydrogenase family)